MTNKLVSIVIPTYKRPTTLPRAIESVLSQTYRPIEIFVVDDNDPDTDGRRETEKLMRKYANNELITYIQHEKNKNGSAARNTGANASHGEYLAFLDDDDEYLPYKIEKQVERLEELDESWGACYCRYYRKTNEGKLISRSKEKREGLVWFDELCRNFWHGGGTGPLVRRRVFEDVGGFDESFFRNQDYEYMMKVTQKYKLAFVNVFGQINYVNSYRESKKSYEEVTENFRKTFQNEINNLDDNHKARFEKMMKLQQFRDKLVVKRNYKGAIKFIFESRVGFMLVFRYIMYLLYRRICKVSCGFKI